VRAEGISERDFRAAVAAISELEFWENDKLWEEVGQSLPNYRLSKFQSLMPPWVEREMLGEYLLDVEGAWRWLSGGTDEGPKGVTEALARAVRAERPEDQPAPPEDVPSLVPTMPVRWVRSDAELAAVCAELGQAEQVALDVETTLRTRALCLVQLAGPEFIALIDALEVSDLAPLGALLGNPGVQKIIHNASFERSVLGKYGIAIENVLDTLVRSRELRGKVEGGHSLKAVCARELGIEVDKAEQVSDWTRRPLTRRQEAYAAMDVELLVRLVEVFRSVTGTVR
ncbi:MAG: ribonuclease D, partial [Planctomycetes bacterium]|nr:ribonuclease D [Planctomycetota bacterium]